MTEFRRIKYIDEWGEEAWKVETRKKFPSGMTGVLAFEAVDYLSDGTWCFNVNLDVRRKRNRLSEYREVTGRDGLETASWVLGSLTYFEQSSIGDKGPFRIEVTADDDRRWKLYEKVLTRRGYTVTMVENQRTLVKRIER